ncbi:MAG: transcription-repair coupling factor [Lachnospiraceae bacterium]|nr:transcription-repair coupling factor [Lachnospiraceae bacterium]
MDIFTKPLQDLAEYGEIISDIREGRTPAGISGCLDSQKCHMICGIGEGFRAKLIVTGSEERARKIYEDYRVFDRDVFYYPAKDLIFYTADIHGDLTVRRRMQCIGRLLTGERVTVVCPVSALYDAVLLPETISKYIFRIETGGALDTDELSKKLVSMGFSRTEQVSSRGEFAVRGGIIDIYNLTDELPYRIELWDDIVDSVRVYDPDSQRSLENREGMTVFPAAEHILDEETLERGLMKIRKAAEKEAAALRKAKNGEAAERLLDSTQKFSEDLRIMGNSVNFDSYVSFFYEKTGSLLDYFRGGDALVFVEEPARTEEEGRKAEDEYKAGMEARLSKGYVLKGQLDSVRSLDSVLREISGMRTVLVSTFLYSLPDLQAQNVHELNVQGMHTYSGNFSMLLEDVRKWKEERYRVLIVSGSRTRGRRLAENLRGNAISAAYTDERDREIRPGEVVITEGGLHSGMVYPSIRFAIITDTDIFGEKKQKRRRKRHEVSGEQAGGMARLSVGDYVVHEKHGIGIYTGTEKVESEGSSRDYLKIEYSGGGKLFVPVSQLDSVQKFAEAGTAGVKVSTLGAKEWTRTRQKAEKAVKDMAAELIRLYAVRERSQGFVCGPDTVWQTEFEEMFPFEETQDQLDAIEDVKHDMESPRIMDRLICGDVGFGKTEVAIRAAFKIVQEGKQCAVLVPTTILAQQHFNTFTERMKNFPVNIALLSRFRTAAQNRETIAMLKAGRIDIVIGTHRLLSKDVSFKDLGLLVIDEEQRFGVAHKEKIKQLRQTVDVITLTATPIPRTMHMSLIGIRDMSLLREAPMNRLPIQTYIMEYDDEMVAEAIRRELDRGGQVYYVYNRVATIAEMTLHLMEIVPEARIEFAHGQMDERSLEKVMYRFINHEIDVLVSTTIIETGMDIPNVNTMIIHAADQMGLSQLYQLRGRVGRSDRTAYAFLLYKRDKVLRETAEKRLAAIREFTDLGSGYRIAMRDLEIRGAGSLLGGEQSGHIEAIGYDLYCKLLSQAITEEKGEKPGPSYETSVDIHIDAYIPDSYIANELRKLEMYKRISLITSEEDYSSLLDEMTDRYGDPPKAAANLLMIARIKALAHEVFVTRVTYSGRRSTFNMYEKSEVNVSVIPDLLVKYSGKLRFSSTSRVPFFVLSHSGPGDVLEEEYRFICDMHSMLLSGGLE